MELVLRLDRWPRACIIVFSLLAGATASGQTTRATPSFEVASIKPALRAASDPRFQGLQETMLDHVPVGFVPMGTQPYSRRVSIRNLSLASIIAVAYRVRKSDLSGPAWMSEQRFDINASVPGDAPLELVNEMLQALLIERFALKLHREMQQQTGYALVIGKEGTRLRPFSPGPKPQGNSGNEAAASQTGAAVPEPEFTIMTKELEKTDRKPARSWVRLKGCTVSEFAHALMRFTDGPVVDMTKLEGKYDVDLEMSSSHVDQESGIEAPGTSVFAAVQDLGLRLERRKLPLEVLVIDSLSKMPTEN